MISHLLFCTFPVDSVELWVPQYLPKRSLARVCVWPCGQVRAMLKRKHVIFYAILDTTKIILALFGCTTRHETGRKHQVKPQQKKGEPLRKTE